MNKSSSSSVGSTTILQMIFLVLKLTKLIDWKWVWVLSPTWISAIVIVVVIILNVKFKWG